MARERAKATRGSSIPDWWLREAGALLAGGVSLFLFLSLWSNRLTGQVGTHLAAPLRQVFGLTAYLVPLAGLAAAIHGSCVVPGCNATRADSGRNAPGDVAALVRCRRTRAAQNPGW